jgi:hypothetical protein
MAAQNFLGSEGGITLTFFSASEAWASLMMTVFSLRRVWRRGKSRDSGTLAGYAVWCFGDVVRKS